MTSSSSESLHVLAIDLGTGGPKVAVVGISGVIVAEEFEPCGLVHTDDGGIEQSPDEWWSAVVVATRRLLEQPAVDRQSIVAIAVTGQWATTVPVDDDGNALMNAISWMDSRGAQYSRAIAGWRLRIAGYGPLKLARWVRMTGGAPGLSGRDPVGHMLLVKNEHPDVYERTSFFLEPVDYLTMRMTGRASTAPETATMHWATNTRDVNNIHYDDRLLKMSTLDRTKMPEIVPSGSIVGQLTAGACVELGLEPIPVISGTPDVMSAAIGSGAVADNAAHLYVGTSGWLSCHVPKKRTDPLHNIAALPSAVPGRYLMCTEQQIAGGSLAHLRDQLLAVPDISYEQLLEEAATQPAGSSGLIFTPWLNGERTPLDDHLVRGAYVNLSLQSSRAGLVRATLEGVALNARWMLHYSERFTKCRLDDIAFIGGGALSPLWCQIVADVLDRNVRQIASPQHANVRGAALHAAVALGHLSWEDVPGRVTSTASYRPDPANRQTYDDLYDEFKRFYRSNRKMYARLNKRADIVN